MWHKSFYLYYDHAVSLTKNVCSTAHICNMQQTAWQNVVVQTL